MYKHYKTIRIQQLLTSTATAVISSATNRSISTLASSSDEHFHTRQKEDLGGQRHQSTWHCSNSAKRSRCQGSQCWNELAHSPNAVGVGVAAVGVVTRWAAFADVGLSEREWGNSAKLDEIAPWRETNLLHKTFLKPFPSHFCAGCLISPLPKAFSEAFPFTFLCQ